MWDSVAVFSYVRTEVAALENTGKTRHPHKRSQNQSQTAGLDTSRTYRKRTVMLYSKTGCTVLIHDIQFRD